MGNLDVTFRMQAKHAELYAAVKKVGSQKVLAERLGVSQALLSNWVCLKSVPRLDDPGNSQFADLSFRQRFEKILYDLTGKTLDELWPPELRNAKNFLNSPKTFELTKTYPIRRLANTSSAKRLLLPDPADLASSKELQIDIVKMLKTLPYREREVLKLRFGLGDNKGVVYTLEDVSHIFKITRERVRQTEARAIKRIKETSRADMLVGHLD